ncbi:MAG: hypothetical protein ACRDMX_09975 [Solirubrobacteraceae bacterium]
MNFNKRSIAGSAAALGASLLCAVALTPAASASAHSPRATSAARFGVRLHAPNHTPTANRKWWITMYITRGRSKLSGSVRYEFLYNGTVVGHRPGIRFKRGYARDDLLFPDAAVGYPLTVRILVSTRYGTVDLNWAVRTRA